MLKRYRLPQIDVSNPEGYKAYMAGATIAAGADYLVVGRPILAAPDPKAAADAIVAEIARAKN